MLNEERKARAEIRSRSVTVLILAIVLAVAVVILSSMSLGWFTTVTDVHGSLTLSPEVMYVEADFLCERKGEDGSFAEVPPEELDGDSIFPLSGLYPGDVLRFTITLTNTSGNENYSELDLTLIGSADERAYMEQGAEARYYWFSSQLKLTSVTLSEGADGSVDFAEGFLFAPTDVDMGSSDPSSPVYTLTDGSPEDIRLCSVELPAGQTVTVTVYLEFFNSPDINQDAYKDFGTPDENGEYPKGYIARRFLVG